MHSSVQDARIQWYIRYGPCPQGTCKDAMPSANLVIETKSRGRVETGVIVSPGPDLDLLTFISYTLFSLSNCLTFKR